MAEWFVGPIMEKVINSCSEYLEDQFRWQTGMKKEMERLRENHPKIQAVVVFASSQAQIGDRNPALNKWLWQLRDAIDEADDLLDEFEHMKLKEQISKNMEETKVRSAPTSFLFESARKLRKIGERTLKIDPNLKRLEEVVQKLDKVSAEVGTFLHLLESAKQEQQEQQLEFYKIRETGSLPKNDLIGRSEDKEFVIRWLSQPSINEEHQIHITPTTLYNNISLLSIVGHGGMGKTTLLQHVYEDEMIKEFDIKMWVCVSNNFDVKSVIASMLESLKKKKPDLESLDALQGSLKSEVTSKKFLLVLDDIWDEEEERDKSKWENVLAPLAYGSLGSKILVTTRMDSIALTITNVLKKKKEILRLKGLKEDVCLQLLNTHAFADVENPDDHTKLRFIAREIVKKLYGSPLAAKVIDGVMNSSFDERHWIKILNSDFRSAEMGQNDIFSILRLSYIFLPRPLQKCFGFCCMFPQDHIFHKDDLVRMWIAVGYIQLSSNAEETIEDVGGRDVSMHDHICNYASRVTRKNIADPNLDERVLDNLQPHNNLKRLKIVEYMGVKSAIWMNNGDLIYNLEYIELHGCLKWQSLPPFGQLPLLKSLCLCSMPKVQQLDNKFHGNDKCCVFPSLEVLHIVGLEALKNWFDAGVAAEDDCLFPRLTDLFLEDCPNLQELPYLPPKLEMLRINNIGWKNLNCRSISKSVPLDTLEVISCQNMTYIDAPFGAS